jgi:hypothetical protein
MSRSSLQRVNEEDKANALSFGFFFTLKPTFAMIVYTYWRTVALIGW